ncbi:MAG: sensor histidine kinase [Bacteroidota bacterium]
MRGTTSPGWEFVPALEQFLRRFERNYGIHTEPDVPDDIRDGMLGQPSEMQLMRIIQEAMANVRKHAQARQARVSLAVRPGEVEVTVENDGRGFDPARTHDGSRREGEGYALGIMRERAEVAGGRLEIHSAPRQGTRVRVRIPLCKDGDVNASSTG